VNSTDTIDTATEAGAALADGHQEESLGSSFTRLSHAAKGFVDAEVTLAKKRGIIIASAVAWIAAFGAIGFVIAFGMIVTLMIGAVMALAPLWGLGLSLLAVTGVALVAILLCGLVIKAQVARILEGTR
jgi:hypothetical protein